MGIVNYQDQTAEAEAALRRQRAAATASSLIIAVLTVVLAGVLLALILLPGLETKTEPIVAYSAPRPEEKQVDRPQVRTEIQRRPSAPSSAMAKVIATTVPSRLAVPVPVVPVPEPSDGFGDGNDFGAGWGSGFGPGGGGASFFGQSVKAERIAYVIDFSSSMGSNGRAELMRSELTKSLSQITPGTEYAIVFFSCIAWVAGSEVDLDRGAGVAEVTGEGGQRFKWEKKGGDRGWRPDGKEQPFEWLSASPEQIAESVEIVEKAPLSSGTAWDNPLEMVMEMEPLPQEVYFMTDGVASGSSAWARTISAKAKARGVRINCIALMEPRAHDDMDELAERTGGRFTIVSRDGTHRQVR